MTRHRRLIERRCTDCGGNGNNGKCLTCGGTGTVLQEIIIDDGQGDEKKGRVTCQKK
jgi:hypothetical protein